MKFLRILITALLFITALLLIIQNQDVFAHKFELKLDMKAYQVGPYIASNLMLIVWSFFIGVVFAVVWGAFYSMSMKGQLREKQRRIKELQHQIGQVQLPNYDAAPEPEQTLPGKQS
ncbi:MAG: lipopolysaccharide assembly protein LapA domain-containing protein [Deltaproteobacteria bacterium]